MTRGPSFIESLVLGGCAFVLSKALLSLILLPDGDTPTDGNSIWRLILTVCYLAVATLLVPYYRDTLFIIRRNWSLVLLVLLALLSCAWAETPSLVFQRAIAVFGTTLLGMALAARLSLEDQLRLLCWVLRIIAVLSLACVLFFPSYGIASDVGQQHSEWQGIFSYKNELGSVMALSVLVEWYLPADTRGSKVVNRLALILSTVLLIFSASVTPLLALIGAVFLVEVYKLGVQRFRIPIYGIVLAVLLIVASGATVLAGKGDRIASALGRSADMTGRTEIWSMVASCVPERPILGYGYSGFWGGASSESAAIDRAVGGAMYSHNGYLEMLVNLGAVGLLLTAGFLCAGIKRVYGYSKRGCSTAYLWPLAFLLFFLLYNLTECTILFQDLAWAVCVATVIGSDAALLGRNAQEEAQEELLYAQRETPA